MARCELAANEIGAMAPVPADADAFYELGLMYAAGRSVPVDLVTAHKWLNIAMVQGCREAAWVRSELAQEMSAAQIAAAQREARLWLTRH
jgi:uncharacterized protein